MGQGKSVDRDRVPSRCCFPSFDFVLPAAANLHHSKTYYKITKPDDVTDGDKYSITVKGEKIFFCDPNTKAWIGTAINGNHFHTGIFVSADSNGIAMGGKNCKHMMIHYTPPGVIKVEGDDDLKKLRKHLTRWVSDDPKAATIYDGDAIKIDAASTPVSKFQEAMRSIMTTQGGEILPFQMQTPQQAGLAGAQTVPAGVEACVYLQSLAATSVTQVACANAALIWLPPGGVVLGNTFGDKPESSRQLVSEHMKMYETCNCKRFAHIFMTEYKLTFPAIVNERILDTFFVCEGNTHAPRMLFLGIESLHSSKLAWHWGLAVGEEVFEVRGEGQLKTNSQAVMGPTGSVAHVGEEVPVGAARKLAEYGPKSGTKGGYVDLKEQTTKTDDAIAMFIVNWVKAHPKYAVLGSNCQLFVCDFFKFLTGKQLPYKKDTELTHIKWPKPHESPNIRWNA